MTSYKTSTVFVVRKDDIVIRHIPDNIIIMPLLFEKRSEKLVKGLACEVVTVRMELDLEIFKEIIYHKISEN